MAGTCLRLFPPRREKIGGSEMDVRPCGSQPMRWCSDKSRPRPKALSGVCQDAGLLSMAHSWKVKEDDFTPEQLG